MNRYEYNGSYPSLAEEYYPGIEWDYEQAHDYCRKVEKELETVRSDSDRKYLHRIYKGYQEKRDTLYWIIGAYRIASLICAHREKISGILHEQSLSEVL